MSSRGAPYRSERRREQAEETRRRVLAAAARCSSSAASRARRSRPSPPRPGVSPETVYAGFRNKRTLLGEVVGQAVRGGDDTPVPEQPGPRAVAASSDQREQLRLFAADVVLRLERVGPLLEVLSVGRAHRSRARRVAREDPHGPPLRASGSSPRCCAPTARAIDCAATESVWALASPEFISCSRAPGAGRASATATGWPTASRRCCCRRPPAALRPGRLPNGPDPRCTGLTPGVRFERNPIGIPNECSGHLRPRRSVSTARTCMDRGPYTWGRPVWVSHDAQRWPSGPVVAR